MGKDTMRVEDVAIASIHVGERRREDYGNMESLVASIRECGLLQPIVIDRNNRLIAGGRRLKAFEMLGRREIPAQYLGDLPEKLRRKYELEENLKRKDFTPAELSRTLVELAELEAEAMRADFMPQTDARKKGRPKKPDNTREIAKRMNVGRATLERAKQHVAILNEHPDLESASQAEALGADTKHVPLSDDCSRWLDDVVRLDRYASRQAAVEALIKHRHRFLPTSTPVQRVEKAPKLKSNGKYI